MANPPIPVDSDFTSDFLADVYSYTTLDNIDHVKIAFYDKKIDPDIWSEIKDKINYHKLEKKNDGIYEINDLSSNMNMNNILIFGLDDENNEVLLATRYLTPPIQLAVVESIKVNINCYIKSETEVAAEYEINYKKHIDNAYDLGLESEHSKIFDGNAADKDYIREKDDNFNENNESILKIVEEFEDDNFNNIQIKKNTPALFAGRGYKYSYFLWYYWNEEKINEKIQELIPDFSINHRPFLGFNERYGSFLYYYEFRNDYIILILVGSNNYNKIDIFICENTRNLSTVDYNNLISSGDYRLKINRWYDRIYFVINNLAWVIYTKENTEPEISEIRELVDSGYLTYKLQYYSPEKLELDNFLDNQRVYMPEFSDIGDVLISIQSNKIKFINIFNEESDDKLNYELLNDYMIDNRPDKKLLLDLYNTTARDLNYLVNEGYKITYIGSEYTVGYNETYGNFMILFKMPKYCQRLRRKLESFDSFVGSYLLFKDSHIESVYGLSLENSESFFGSKFDSEDNPMISSDRGIVVLKSNKYKGCFRCTQ